MISYVLILSLKPLTKCADISIDVIYLTIVATGSIRSTA
jgi:hypothetical protein